MSKMNVLAAKISRTVTKGMFKVKKHSPELLLAAGIVGGIATTVVACKQTTKLNSILEEHNKEIEKHEAAVEDPESLPEGETYTEEDLKEDKRTITIQTGVKIVKLYAPAVIIGGLSVAAILASNNIMRKRNLALASSLASVTSAFEEYRKRVVKKYGEEADYDLITGKTEESTVEVVDGEVVSEEKPELASPTCKYFDETCKGYTGDPNLDLMALMAHQDALSNKLRTQGHLFLNEAYDELGIQRTPIGQRLGWIYDEKNPIGDNFVDFGIHDENCVANRRFVNGLEKYPLLNFNIDGDIVDKI